MIEIRTNNHRICYNAKYLEALIKQEIFYNSNKYNERLLSQKCCEGLINKLNLMINNSNNKKLGLDKEIRKALIDALEIHTLFNNNQKIYISFKEVE